MTNKSKGLIMYYTGLVISILAPFIATLTQFPVWTKEVDPKQVSAMFIVMAVVCAVPLLNHFKQALKSPSAIAVWVFLFLVTWGMSQIIKQVMIIALVGMIANIIGAVLCGIGNKLKAKPDPIEYDEEGKTNG